MIAGRFAFQGLSEYLTWQKIKQLDYTFPEGFDPDAADLVRRLLVRYLAEWISNIVCSNLCFMVQVRDPLERLGAGPPEDEHSMEALRGHSFFASIRWDTLWDDPAPPLETGLVRREPALVDEWDDVGATWDELVSGPDGSGDEDEDDESVEGYRHYGNAHAHARARVPGDDGIEWAPDAQVFVSPPLIPPEEIGPHGEIPDYARVSLPLAVAVDTADAVDAMVAPVTVVNGVVGAGPEGALAGGFGIRFTPPMMDSGSNNTTMSAGEDLGLINDPDPTSRPSPGHVSGEGTSTERGSPASSSAETGEGGGEAAARELLKRESLPLPVPRGLRDSYATSSSDGSPVEKLGAALEAMGIHRGRLRTRSPTPARGDATSAAEAPDWCVSLLYPLPTFAALSGGLLKKPVTLRRRASVLGVGETMLFHATVEETAMKRRTSRLLLPLPVSQRKQKVRELALTSHRLLCLKPLKNGRGVGIKARFMLGDATEGQLAGSGREKRAAKGDEVRGTVTGVERKGAKEFVVLTVRSLFRGFSFFLFLSFFSFWLLGWRAGVVWLTCCFM
jgi:3-phosphoinositide dependent protein kinase-1